MATTANNKAQAITVKADEARKELVLTDEYRVISVAQAVRYGADPAQVQTLAASRKGANALWVWFDGFKVV